ncbi:Sulfate transporter 3.2 [Orobanche hederae]
MKKMNKSRFVETIGQEWIFLTVGNAVGACNYMLHSCKPKITDNNDDDEDEAGKFNNNV